MPIPAFDHNHVLPPRVGAFGQRATMSPFAVTSLDLAKRFATSTERVAILHGLLELRSALRRVGLTGGFQWIDGSFVEDVERARNRSPRDVDVVTFYRAPSPPRDAELTAILANHAMTLDRFRVDHYLVPLCDHPEQLVASSRYFFGLFSQQRETAVWKGMLQIDLMTAEDDLAAGGHLTELSFP